MKVKALSKQMDNVEEKVHGELVAFFLTGWFGREVCYYRPCAETRITWIEVGDPWSHDFEYGCIRNCEYSRLVKV